MPPPSGVVAPGMHEYAVTAALTISFQRYPYPPSGWIGALPGSRGALPFAITAPRYLVLPCPTGEAFWIGLILAPGGPSSVVSVVASLESGERVDAAAGTAPEAEHDNGGGIVVPPRFAVEGIARQDGTWWALTRDALETTAPSCVGLELLVRTGPPIAAAAGAGAGPRPQHDLTGPADHSPPSTLAGASGGPPTAVRVDLTDAAGFEAISGERLPRPLDEDATWRGWRLP